MLRAPLRFPLLIPSLTSAPSKPYHSILSIPFSKTHSAASVTSRWAPPPPAMAAARSFAGRVCFSAGRGEGGGGGGGSKKILVQHLLLEQNNLDLLVELQQRTAQGEDLSDLAVKHSICPSKESGGMLGWVR